MREAVRSAAESLATKEEVAAVAASTRHFVTSEDLRAAVESVSAKAAPPADSDVLRAADRDALRAEVAALRRLLWLTWVGLAALGVAVLAVAFCAGSNTPPCDLRGRGDVADLAAVTEQLRADVDALMEVRSTPRGVSEGVLRVVGALIVLGGTFWAQRCLNGPTDQSCGEPKAAQSTDEKFESAQ